MKIKTLLWSGFAAICALMAVLVSIGIWQLDVIDKATEDVTRADDNESMARDIAERMNGMRRYQLSALVVAADERDQEFEALRPRRAGKMSSSRKRSRRSSAARRRGRLASNMRTLNERYVRSHEQVVALAREGKIDAMRELIQGDARAAQRELAAESEKFIKIQQERKAQAEKGGRGRTVFGRNADVGLAGLGRGGGGRHRLSVTRRITGSTRR
jgi:CHASE3 domain sensor protein